MGMLRLSIVSAFVLLLAAGAAAQNKGKGKGKGDKGDKGNKDGALDVVGTIYEYKLTKDGQTASGTFRVFQHEMFKGAKKIGTIKEKDADEATFTVNGDPELNGSAEYRIVQTKPRRFKGTLVKPNGDKWHLEVEPKDR